MAEKMRTDFSTASKIPIMVDEEKVKHYTAMLKTEDKDNYVNLDCDTEDEFDNHAKVTQDDTAILTRKRSLIEGEKSNSDVELNSPTRKRAM